MVTSLILGGEALKDWLHNAKITACKNQNAVHLPLVFSVLVFGNFIKGCAKVHRVPLGGGECCLNAHWNSSQRFSGLLCLQPQELGSSSPTSLLLLVLTMRLAGRLERRMEAATGTVHCHFPHLHALVQVPGHTDLWP